VVGVELQGGLQLRPPRPGLGPRRLVAQPSGTAQGTEGGLPPVPPVRHPPQLPANHRLVRGPRRPPRASAPHRSHPDQGAHHQAGVAVGGRHCQSALGHRERIGRPVVRGFGCEIERERSDRGRRAQLVVGVDALAVLSAGEVIPNPRHLGRFRAASKRGWAVPPRRHRPGPQRSHQPGRPGEGGHRYREWPGNRPGRPGERTGRREVHGLAQVLVDEPSRRHRHPAGQDRHRHPAMGGSGARPRWE